MEKSLILTGWSKRGCLAAVLGGVVYMLGAMSRVAVPGMVFERIAAEYGFSPAQVALLPSAGVVGCMAFIGLGGVAVDRFGWLKMLLLGTLLQIVGYLPVHESADLPLLLAGEFINGGGRTMVYLSMLKFLDVSFDRRYFAALLGIFYIFSYGGTLAASAVFPSLEGWCGSWQHAARALNFATLALAASIVLVMPSWRSARPMGASAVREAFPWRGMLASFRHPAARRAMVIAALNIAVYWSFLCVVAAPFARRTGEVSIVSEMNWVVMFGMVFSGSICLHLGNRRRPFFVWGGAALALGFGLLALSSPGLAVARTAYLLIGAGYGVTSVLLTGVKECVPPLYMASAIGFTNFLANVAQVGCNQASGRLMAFGDGAWPWIFAIYLALSVISLTLSASRGGLWYNSRPMISSVDFATFK